MNADKKQTTKTPRHKDTKNVYPVIPNEPRSGEEESFRSVEIMSIFLALKDSSLRSE
jgi:hypothetical protein